LKAMPASLSNFRCDTPETVTKPPSHLPSKSYRRLMKNTKIFSPLMWLLLGSVAFAQAGIADVPEAPQPHVPDTARNEPAKIGASSIEPTAITKPDASDGRLISQARHFPRPPHARMRPPAQAYRPAAPMPGLSPMGALIGFGAGAALGASRSPDHSAGGRAVAGLFIGGIGALIGGIIGSGPPVWHRRRAYPPYGDGDDDDDDSNLRSDARTIKAKPSVTKKPAAPGKSSAVESATLVPQEELAVP
jgi:hypothetical protein